MFEAPTLRVVRLRLRFIPASHGRQSGLAGSAWRGAMGYALRAAACTTGQPTCPGCARRQECDYSLAFESPRPEGQKFFSTDAVPHPFSLVARTTSVGEEELLLCLFGEGLRYLAPLTQALEHAAASGIGPDRVRYRLGALEAESPLGSGLFKPLSASLAPPAPASAPSAPAHCQVRLLTPLRLRRDNRYLGPAEIQFADLAANLVRRLAALCRLYAQPLDADFRALAAVGAAPFEWARLRWHDWARYSSRQERAIRMGGVLGAFQVAPEPAVWPYLWFGQFIQAGKGTALGLGHFEVQAL